MKIAGGRTRVAYKISGSVAAMPETRATVYRSPGAKPFLEEPKKRGRVTPSQKNRGTGKRAQIDADVNRSCFGAWMGRASLKNYRRSGKNQEAMRASKKKLRNLKGRVREMSGKDREG